MTNRVLRKVSRDIRDRCLHIEQTHRAELTELDKATLIIAAAAWTLDEPLLSGELQAAQKILNRFAN